MDDHSYELIRGWYDLAQGERPNVPDDVMHYFRFMALWIAFNSWCTREHGGQPREQVEQFAQNCDNAARHEESLRDPEYLDAVEVLAETAIRDLGPNKSRPAAINDCANLEQVLLATYRVRCNLFHGEKSIDNDRDQRLVQASFTTVSRLLEPLLQNDTER